MLGGAITKQQKAASALICADPGGYGPYELANKQVQNKFNINPARLEIIFRVRAVLCIALSRHASGHAISLSTILVP